MARTINRLSARFVATVAEAGRYADGGNLYLSVSPNGGRRWVFMFRWAGKVTEMGLGSARDVTLARAREKAAEARALIAEGRNPLEARRVTQAIPTFGEAADALIASMESSWRNPKHRAQWRMTLTHYAAPLRPVSVDQVTTDDVLKVLRPIWQTKPETASRLRGRIERVIDAARAQGHRVGDNPARWRGHLDTLLPPPRKLSRGHHGALPYSEVPTFLARLRALNSVSARALEFTILTAARSGETMGATWAEIDLDGKVWTVPADRMKAKRPHRVPLTDRPLQILAEMLPFRSEGDYVFPGAKRGRPLSVMALDMVLRRLKEEVATTHGFRSSFRDWAAEETTFAREVAEAALAHLVGDQTERAYRRGDALEKRRALMHAWEEFTRASAS